PRHESRCTHIRILADPSPKCHPAGPRSPPPIGAAAGLRRENGSVERLTAAETAKRRALRRMKTVAAGLLVLATVLYGVSGVFAGRVWLGYVHAAAEASMVGALADWFAVTALFRRPLGLSIPHTALIPNRKNLLGASLGDF